MIKIKLKIEVKNIRQFVTKTLKGIGDYAFLFFIGLVIFGLIFGGLVLYGYNSSIKKPVEQFTGRNNQFNEDIYKNILEEWNKREERLNGIDSKTYIDPFFGPPIEEVD